MTYTSPHARQQTRWRSDDETQVACEAVPWGIAHGKQCPGIRGKVVDWTDHAFEEGILYIRVRFTDRTELCWRIVSSIEIEEADLSDWKTGNFRQLKVFVRNESDGA